MNETEAAQQIRDGALPSPFQFGGMTLFALRVTGTGLSYRSAHDEHVWRSPELYLSEDFLARVPGLPVIWEHPESSMLNSEEFANRIIGTAALPYIVDDEVWAVCRLYDDEAIKAMTDGQLSTSPAVVFKPTDGNTVQEHEGVSILVEGIPSYLDHLAVCAQGVWDKSGPPLGVQNDTLERADAMAEETKEEKEAREEKDRKDAARRDEAIDKMLTGLDSMSKRMDAWEKSEKDRKDAEEKSRKDAEESAMMDAKKRRDEEHEKWREADAEECARDDAEEKAECDAMVAKGDAQDAAEEKARADRRDRMDRRRKDAEKEEKDRKDAQARADAAKVEADSDLARRIADGIRAHTRSDSDTAAMADMQVRADAVHQSFGNRAPAPMLAEATHDYRLRLARGLQKHSAEWKDVNLGILELPAFAIAEKQIYADSVVASRSTDDMPDGQLIPIRRTDVETGHRITEFRGKTTIFKSLSAPSQRVTAFLTANRGS